MIESQTASSSSDPVALKRKIDNLVDYRFRLKEEILLVGEALKAVPDSLVKVCHTNCEIPQLEARAARHYPEYAQSVHKDASSLGQMRDTILRRKQSIAEHEQSIVDCNKSNEGLKYQLTVASVILFPLIPLFIAIYRKQKKPIEPIQALIQDDKKAIQQQTSAMEQQFALAVRANEQAYERHLSYSKQSLELNAGKVRAQTEQLPLPLRGNWEDPGWASWSCASFDGTPKFLTIGTESEPKDQSGSNLSFPVLAPFIGGGSSIVIEGDEKATAVVMHAMVLQAAIMLPHKIRFSFLDPAGQGSAFPMQRKLPLVRKSTDHLYQILDSINDDIKRVNTDYLDDEVTSFEDLPQEVKVNQRYELIVAAKFPEEYDRRSIEALQKISRNGPKAGKYLLIQKTSAEMPREMSLADFPNLHACHLGFPSREGLERCPVTKMPSALQQYLYEDLENAQPPEHKLNWQDLALDEKEWWTKSSEQFVEVAVGSAGAERKLNLWFGQKKNGQQCSHGVLGAMTGSGKSGLFHAIISGLAMRYSPQEVQFYLVDGKQGVEFQSYRVLPHARVVSLHSLPEFSRSILRELHEEMNRRFETFKGAGVSGLSEYRALGHVMPRLLLLADEYSDFFEMDREDIGSQLILQLAQQGRAAGIHMLLGGQSFSGADMKSRNEVFANIHLRLGMKMSQETLNNVTEFGPEGKRLIEACDLAGKIVINDQSGNDGANEMGKVALITKEDRDKIVKAVMTLASKRLKPEELGGAILFEGNKQPQFTEMPATKRLLALAQRPTEASWQNFARAPIHEVGLGIPEWFDGEFPVPLWLGQEYNLHGHAFTILRRLASENALVVGESNAARYGIIQSMLCSLALRWPEEKAQVILMDKCVPGTPWSEVLTTTVEKVLPNNGIVLRQNAELIAQLGTLRDILRRRIELSEAELQKEKSIYLFLSEPDRINPLHLAPNKHGFLAENANGELLKEIYSRGPAVGIHLIASTAALLSMTQVIPRRNLEQHFKHRIALQMSEDDSFMFVKSRIASQLQPTPTPVSAYYLDILGGRKSRLKPFVITNPKEAEAEVNQVATTLQTWSKVT